MKKTIYVIAILILVTGLIYSAESNSDDSAIGATVGNVQNESNRFDQINSEFDNRRLQNDDAQQYILSQFKSKKIVNIGLNYSLITSSIKVGDEQYLGYYGPSLRTEMFFFNASSKMNIGLMLNGGYIFQTQFGQKYIDASAHLVAEYFGKKHFLKFRMAMGYNVKFKIDGNNYVVRQNPIDGQYYGGWFKKTVKHFSFEIGGKFYNKKMNFCFYFNICLGTTGTITEITPGVTPLTDKMQYGLNFGFLVNVF